MEKWTHIDLGKKIIFIVYYMTEIGRKNVMNLMIFKINLENLILTLKLITNNESSNSNTFVDLLWNEMFNNYYFTDNKTISMICHQTWRLVKQIMRPDGSCTYHSAKGL